jgi:hypothetical protein
MCRAGAAATLALVAICAQSPASAQPPPDLRNDKIKIDYYEPRNPDLMPLYEKLQRRAVLEQLSQFLAPVRWPKTLRLIMKECPAGAPRPEISYVSVERSVNICYQLFTFLRSLEPPRAFGTKQEVIVGGLIGVALHTASRATFDMLNIPRLGDEGDAADQLSAFLGLQFGDDVARVVIKGTYFVWKRYDEELAASERLPDFAARSSVPRQRMYNTLCIAYGGVPAVFKTFVDQGDLLSTRAESCADEYQSVRQAFQKTIVPYVDAGMMAKARSTQWIGPDDLK